MVIDDQIDAVDQAAEVMRLHVDHRDAIVFLERVRRNRLDVNIQQVDHAEVFRTRDALDRADDRRGLGAPQDVAQRQAAGHGVGVRIVVQHDQHPLRVSEEALVLMDARARQRSAELGEQRPAEQLRHREIRRRR